ncbi:uncharacterized protein ASPGLDRAFT_729453 [Aspergillus glaucus CBS 516.65]|uniref:Uncharacterized protein n=1 Tax=Aspergillus glaucus CBS 516.65 TaxID=1160497 RepID=A0A1L9VXN2_ASPGL|nr:hypothetical protein ASPGLDRAFT_729453 [Aspergillus glaucus CBS 516.65]OJJ88665.1 hypothetical protein ASPGLDRAFT_729453 [Aspergillus glaucus CBS 516.65]
MLTQQPPLRFLGVIETWIDLEWPLFTQILVQPNDEAVNDYNLLMSGQDPLVLWNNPHPFKRNDWELRAETEKVTTTYMRDCDLITFCGYCYLFKWENASNYLDHWIVSLGRHKRIRGLFRKPI